MPCKRRLVYAASRYRQLLLGVRICGIGTQADVVSVQERLEGICYLLGGEVDSIA